MNSQDYCLLLHEGCNEKSNLKFNINLIKWKLNLNLKN